MLAHYTAISHWRNNLWHNLSPPSAHWAHCLWYLMRWTSTPRRSGKVTAMYDYYLVRYANCKLWSRCSCEGPWRWINEETLLCDSTQICGHSIEKIRSNGMNFKEFESLARCHGARINSHRVDASDQHDDRCVHGLQRFQHLVKILSSDSSGRAFMVVNFSRKALGIMTINTAGIIIVVLDNVLIWLH